MAVYQTYQTVGIREDLADIIYSIAPTETPFMSGVAKTKATNTSHQWQTDALVCLIYSHCSSPLRLVVYK